MKILKNLGLVLITDRKHCKLPFLETIKLAIKGGVKTVQLREKDMQTNDLFELALELRRITLESNANLIINDRIDVMLAVGADGVHIGKGSLPLKIVRKIIGNNKLIGFSAHSPDEARRTQDKGADYVSLSPIFYSSSKGSYVKPIGTGCISKTKEITHIPVIALGGINEENIEEVLKSGADGVAVMSSILQASDPFIAARKMNEKIGFRVQLSGDREEGDSY